MAGHSSDRNRPLGPADITRSSSGSAHIQLFLSLTSKGEKGDREMKTGGKQQKTSCVLNRHLQDTEDSAQTQFLTWDVTLKNISMDFLTVYIELLIKKKEFHKQICETMCENSNKPIKGDHF
ncbi:hypothetical protein ILYODFUR_018271 [Ilyodon furcidens]|uniref:Uncharacterized protein n=1 Tax=Ilyodon furcidens TaxID=33524 RepID=A0ABV0UWY8_9TELE